MPSSHDFDERFFAALRFAYKQPKYNFGEDFDSDPPVGAWVRIGREEVDTPPPPAVRAGTANTGRTAGRATGLTDGGAPGALATAGLTNGDLNPAAGFVPPGGRNPPGRKGGLNAARGGLTFVSGFAGDSGARFAGSATSSPPLASSGAARFIARGGVPTLRSR
tara:strand:- start:20083 stop:20574 length:492 start_codon:yes stop_codon:yes gene_type:complete